MRATLAIQKDSRSEIVNRLYDVCFWGLNNDGDNDLDIVHIM